MGGRSWMNAFFEQRDFYKVVEGLKRKGRGLSRQRADAIGAIAIESAVEAFYKAGLWDGRPSTRHGIRYLNAFGVDVQASPSGEAARVKLYNRHPAAKFIEQGTEAHMIPPQSASTSLQWPAWRSYSRQRPVTMAPGYPAWHPGTIEYRVLNRAMNSAVQKQRRVVRRFGR